ncbi:HDIG domain-containing protein [Paenibacillus sp. 598K]|uniref:HD-GYP domain-containing protein n=1 Tax=Paenibacillus sp. 598K TaxID=1117987 RepID=UPI000FFA4816|nr:HD-GYP domain-containing protein [Paenibacillus sp. 598K]GBF76940.1 HDIG domain-containing protein [Paenibacillus sp. 598K]
MPDAQWSHMQALVGRRLNKNIYTKQDVLACPAHTVLTEQMLRKLIQLGVELQAEDVESRADTIDRVVEHAVKEMKGIFHFARESGQLVVDDIRVHVVPTIRQSAEAGMLYQMLNRLQLEDDVTCRHSIAVAMVGVLIGQWLRLSEEEIGLIAAGGLLHDVGKLRVPAEILNKPGRLTEEEFAEMKRHTVYGYEMLRGEEGVEEDVARVALRHHERLDGSGYPYGLKGEEIDRPSRIIAVADVFHAMLSKRVYKNELPFYQVIKEIAHSAFSQFDASVVAVFARKMMETMIGSQVILSDGQIGTVISVHLHDPANPLVRAGERFYDLSVMQELHIVHFVPNS